MHVGSGGVSARVCRDREAPRSDRQAPRQMSPGRRLTATSSSLILPRSLPAATGLGSRRAGVTPGIAVKRQWSLYVGRDALVGEIKEEVAAAGRRRGTFAGKGIAAQRSTHLRPRLKGSERFRLATWTEGEPFCPQKRPGFPGLSVRINVSWLAEAGGRTGVQQLAGEGWLACGTRCRTQCAAVPFASILLVWYSARPMRLIRPSCCSSHQAWSSSVSFNCTSSMSRLT